MQLFLLILELIGTVAFAVSGAMVGLKKNMDLFGVATLGLTTAVGGGIIRDLILGVTPPGTFRDPIYAVVAIATSLVVFFPAVRHVLMKNQRVYDWVMLWMDAFGLGAFTVVGVQVAYSQAAGYSWFLLMFVGVVTGVGGGVLRDTLAGLPPYIFVKHIYACASIAGALLCMTLWPWAGSEVAMVAGTTLVVGLRVLSAHFRWSLPKAGDGEKIEI